MPDGGLSTTEAARKSQLNESTARNKRGRISNSLISGLEGTQKKFEGKTRTNLAISNFMAQEFQERGVKPRGYLSSQMLGAGSSAIQNRLVGNQQNQPTDTEQKTNQNQPTDSPDQPKDQVKADQQSQQQNESARKTKLETDQQKNRLTKAVVGQFGEKIESVDEIRDKAQKQVKKAFMKLARTGSEELAQGIGTALDIGTAGVSTIVTIFMYAVTLVDLNAQMVWGYYIKHDKSFLVPALTWEPIPMPKIVSPRVLHAGLVMVDFLVIGAITIMFTLIILILLIPQAIIAGGLISSWEFLSEFVL